MWEWVSSKQHALEARRARMVASESKQRRAIEAVLAWQAAGGGTASRNSRKRAQESYGVGVTSFANAERTIESLKHEPELLEAVLAARMTIKQALDIEWDRRGTRDRERVRAEPYLDRGETVVPGPPPGQAFFDLVSPRRDLTSRAGIYGML